MATHLVLLVLVGALLEISCIGPIVNRQIEVWDSNLHP